MNLAKWQNKLLTILKIYGVSAPKTFAIYREALTHKSYANENRLSKNQQRLEFLGDAAIGWVISNYLYGLNENLDEGKMTTIKSWLVKTETLALFARNMSLHELLFLGKGMDREKLSDNILEDTFEAFIGAIAQDQGIKKVFSILKDTLILYYEDNPQMFQKDAKTEFQELVQSVNGHDRESINYKHSEKDNKKYSKLYYGNLNYGVGVGNTWKEADQQAAKEALQKYYQPRKEKK